MGKMETLNPSDTREVMAFARKYDKHGLESRTPMLGGIELMNFLRDALIMCGPIEPDFDIKRRKGDIIEQARVKVIEAENEYLRLRLKQLERFDRRKQAEPINHNDRRAAPSQE